jgi:transcription initiation factor IIE alpha subunit
MKELIKHILKEETEEINQKVMNFLLRRYEVKEYNSYDQIRFKKVFFKVGDEVYGIGTFDNKKRQIRLILNMLEENNVIEPVDNFSNENDPYRQKIVRTIKRFLEQVM